MKINLTAFVDSKFGNDHHAKVNSSEDQFKTIKAAVVIIHHLKKSKKEEDIFYNILVSPGFYNEHVVLPHGINLIGSGKTSTMITSLKIKGSTTISNIQIKGSFMPLLKGRFSSNGNVFIENIYLDISLRKTPKLLRQIISFIGTRQTNVQIHMNDVTLNSNFSSLMHGGIDTILNCKNGVKVNIMNPHFSLSSFINSQINCIQAINGGEINLIGGSVNINLIGILPLMKDIIFFEANERANLNVRNNEITLKSNSSTSISKSFVIYMKSISDGKLKSIDSSFDFSAIPLTQRILGLTENDKGKILMQNIKSISGPGFPLIVGPGKIKLVGENEDGDVIITGKFISI